MPMFRVQSEITIYDQYVIVVGSEVVLVEILVIGFVKVDFDVDVGDVGGTVR